MPIENIYANSSGEGARYSGSAGIECEDIHPVCDLHRNRECGVEGVHPFQSLPRHPEVGKDALPETQTALLQGPKLAQQPRRQGHRGTFPLDDGFLVDIVDQ